MGLNTQTMFAEYAHVCYEIMQKVYPPIKQAAAYEPTAAHCSVVAVVLDSAWDLRVSWYCYFFFSIHRHHSLLTLLPFIYVP
jgi:hypothetical protein